MENRFLAPHYVREYRHLVRFLQRRGADEASIFERAVGGNYHQQGEAQAKLVLGFAPEGPFNLLDVGCGSGRLSHALRDEKRVSYLGVDVVPDLIEYAQRVSARPDWRFETIDSLNLPCPGEWADVVVFMSVLTHLKPAECRDYIAEAARTLKPGGLVIASYLNRDHPPHRRSFRPAWRQRIARFLRREVMISFTTPEEMTGWFENAGLTVRQTITDKSPVGQHVMIGVKPLEQPTAQ
ncbi:class I SAM-dependent methyltransferase [Hyphococcus sp.]|jgi:2-polyprenyl-3-methyl-5-hydroxy-6-metoxy-1,4-benzoquinol methylase|uniref:class I SAM-dependent methyltransferase n=1 Tax=Hyphococcus sp. TaxID=2038636 RepID=UPI003D1352A7